MPVDYAYDFNIIVITMSGEYSLNDLRSALVNSLVDPKRPRDSVLMFDFGESQSVYSRTTGEIQNMTDFITSMRYRYNHCLAIVSSFDLPRVLKRFVSVKSETYGIDSEVFHSYGEAREWLVAKHFQDSRKAQTAQTAGMQPFR